jgi:hypothetical protein
LCYTRHESRAVSPGGLTRLWDTLSKRARKAQDGAMER